MTTQHFHGPVQQVAGRDVREAPSAQDIAARRRQLIERAAAHAAQRAAAGRRVYINGWSAALGMWMLVMAAYAWHLVSTFSVRPDSGGHSMAITLILAASSFVPAIGLGRLRIRCQADWQYHNEAIRDINRMINTL